VSRVFAVYYTMDLTTDLLSESYQSRTAAGRPFCLANLAAVLIFPIPILTRVRLNKVRKYSIMAIFGVGSICIIVGSVCYSKLRKSTGSRNNSASWLLVWSVVESSIGNSPPDCQPLSTRQILSTTTISNSLS
jgi:hypothetical protein